MKQPETYRKVGLGIDTHFLIQFRLIWVYFSYNVHLKGNGNVR